MFEEIERDYSFLFWVLQSVLAFFGPLMAWAFISIEMNLQDTIRPQIAGYAFVAAAACGCALVVGRFFRSSALEGVWIWPIPVIILLWGVAETLVSDGLAAAVNGFVFVPGPGRGEESWGILLTIPTWACCWYSATMWWGHNRRLRYTQWPLEVSRDIDR